jgi:LysR family transcriptional regulator, carnitine catabolism transcriptional activator
MDLRHLEFVVAIVDHGGVGRAATALHVAQPSVSASVRGLEHELGVNLFDRIGRRLVLTDAGATVVDHARQLLAGRERLAAELADQQGLLAGTLRLVSLPTLATDSPPLSSPSRPATRACTSKSANPSTPGPRRSKPPAGR